MAFRSILQKDGSKHQNFLQNGETKRPLNSPTGGLIATIRIVHFQAEIVSTNISLADIGESRGLAFPLLSWLPVFISKHERGGKS